MSKLRVLVAAGGSGGHLFPAQQLGELLKEKAEVAFAGHRLSESPFFQREKAQFAEIAAAPLKKGFLVASWRGFWQAVHWIRKFQPEVVVGFGSFHSFPVLLAAVCLRKKLVLFEANCAVGKVNRLFRPFAKRVLGQFEPVGKCLVPLLPWKEIGQISREGARRYFGLDEKRPTLLVFGGSQGATFLNEWMPKVCALLCVDVQVIHFSGKGEAHYSVPCCTKPFEKEMAQAYAAADVAICRAGAGTIAELIRFQVPALLIPFPHATEDHQRKNGEFFVEKIGGGRLLLQKEAGVERGVREVEQLLEKREEHRQKLREYFLQSRKRMRIEEVVCGI